MFEEWVAESGGIRCDLPAKYQADPRQLVGDGIFYDEPKPLRWLIGQLWNCTDTMPSLLCETIGLPQGASYAQAVRSLTGIAPRA